MRKPQKILISYKSSIKDAMRLLNKQLEKLLIVIDEKKILWCTK